jgi:hypothetical protein
MGYSSFHETSNLCPKIVGKGARMPPSRAALQRHLRPSPLPDTAHQRPWQLAAQDSRESRVRLANGQERHPLLQREGLGCPHGWLLDSEARACRLRRRELGRAAAGDAPPLAEGVRGYERVACGLLRWPQRLPLRRDSPFEEGLTEKRVSGQTIRATLSRLLGIRWQRAKRWITSPDPLYERKKGGATD